MSRRILFIPIYTERGSPIATRLMVETLLDLGHEVELLVYHEGDDIDHDGLTLHRIASPPGIHDVPIGLSVRKLVCDVWLARTFTKLVWTGRFDVIHAGEEAAEETLQVFEALTAGTDSDGHQHA